jgi:hypothetical protein
MTTFDEREQAFEAKFAKDEEQLFQARARCHKQLGLWAAAILGHHGDAAQDYANALVAAGLKSHGNRDVLNRIAADMTASHISAITPEIIEDKMTELLSQS